MIRGEDIQVLDDMFDSRKTFHIPVYQRNYDWKKEHCEKIIIRYRECSRQKMLKNILQVLLFQSKKEDDQKKVSI